MKVSLNINTEVELNQVLGEVATKELISIVEARPDKAEILEAFSSAELAGYIVHNNLINEELIALLISDKKLSLELILGKVAIAHFEKTVNATIS